MRVYVEGVGLRAPGLDGWLAGQEVLAGRRSYEPTTLAVPSCDLLPPAERRRAIPSVKLALAVGTEAVGHAGCDARSLTTVFAASSADTVTIHNILETLASPGREVSPTRFQNSVHNAPAGYWSIATHSHQPSISLCGFDATVAAGLLEAAARVRVDRCKVGLIVYDLPLQEPLNALRPIRWPFAAALILDPEPSSRAIASLAIELRLEAGEASRVEQHDLEALRLGNPAARLLPVLQALSQPGEGRVFLDHIGTGQIAVTYTTYRTAP